MKNQNKSVSEETLLRLLAEEKLKNEKLTVSDMEAVDNMRLIHELHVHQIELEMQNEELELAKEKAVKAIEKYTELYDFAPSGYLSITKEGNIVDINFSAAKLLGKDRIHLKNTRFGLYIQPECIETYNQTIVDSFRINSKMTCEIFLISSIDTATFVHIDAIVQENSNLCLITIVDISQRKQLENILSNTASDLKLTNSYFVDREIRMIALKNEINELLAKSGSKKRY